MVRNNRGWARLIEIALAAAMVFSYMIFLQNIYIADVSSTSGWDTARLKQFGESALITYDQQDSNNDQRSDLRTDLAGGYDVDATFKQLLPANVGYYLYIFDENGNLNPHAGDLPIPPYKDKASVTYIMAGGYDGEFCTLSGSPDSPCALEMVLWFKQ
jgi:hypothetical protein